MEQTTQYESSVTFFNFIIKLYVNGYKRILMKNNRWNLYKSSYLTSTSIPRKLKTFYGRDIRIVVLL